MTKFTVEDWLVLNCGVNRERADQIRAPRSRHPRLDPDVLVIIVGVNDIYRGPGAEAVECQPQTADGTGARARYQETAHTHRGS